MEAAALLELPHQRDALLCHLNHLAVGADDSDVMSDDGSIGSGVWSDTGLYAHGCLMLAIEMPDV